MQSCDKYTKMATAINEASIIIYPITGKLQNWQLCIIKINYRDHGKHVTFNFNNTLLNYSSDVTKHYNNAIKGICYNHPIIDLFQNNEAIYNQVLTFYKQIKAKANKLTNIEYIANSYTSITF